MSEGWFPCNVPWCMYYTGKDCGMTACTAYHKTEYFPNIDVDTLLTDVSKSDYVKVARCKDCRHRNQYGECIQQYTEYGREKKVDDDFFCAGGERKETLC